MTQLVTVLAQSGSRGVECCSSAQLCLCAVLDPRAWDGAAHTSGGPSTSVNPIKKTNQTFAEVCLLGDSRAGRVGDRDTYGARKTI